MVDFIPIRLSAMHHTHIRSGATFVEKDGWQQPAFYDSLENELSTLQHSVGICDISPTGKLLMQGHEIKSWLSKTSLRIEPPSIGNITQFKATNEPVSESIGSCCILTEDELLLLAPPSCSAQILTSLEEPINQCTHIVDVTSGLSGIKIIGPNAQSLLSTVTDFDLTEERFINMSCAQVNLLGIHNILLRVDIGNIRGYEIYFAREFGQYIWESLERYGKPTDVKPVGIDSLTRLKREQLT